MTLNKTSLEVLKAIAYIVDVEETEKLYHSWRVAEISRYLAEEKCKESALPIYVAGLLHDVGTFDIPNRLVHYKNHFQDSKNSDVRVHPQKSAAIASSLPGFIPVAKIILDHHEWINGKGYPRGLKHSEISIESQILRIADSGAFLLEGGQIADVNVLKESLKKESGREFSEELYECLTRQLEKKNAWEQVSGEKKLSNLVEETFSHLPVEEKNDPITGKDLFSFFGRILDAKHSYTEGHSRRVSYFSVLIALALDLSDEDVRRIESAAFLHDIGKVGMPKSILNKKGSLKPDEFKIIKKHASFSREIVKKVSLFKDISGIVGSDQEHWDGSGYPEGLKGEQIPLEARIIFVADAFDAMTSNRSYHKAISTKDAISRLKECSGKDFDPEIVKIFSKLFEGFTNPSILACQGQ